MIVYDLQFIDFTIDEACQYHYSIFSDSILWKYLFILLSVPSYLDYQTQ